MLKKIVLRTIISASVLFANPISADALENIPIVQTEMSSFSFHMETVGEIY